jgi:outer membrane protein
MTFGEAVAYARANRPSVRAALARIEQQRQAAQIPRAQWLPVLGATAQLFGATANNTTGTYVTPSFMDIPRIGGSRVTSSGSFQPYPATFAGIGATQEVFDFGRIAAQTAAADALVDVERQRVRSEILDVTFDVEEAYYAVFAAKKIVRASEAAVGRSRAHRDFASAGVGAGMRPPIELTRAEADLRKFELGEIRAKSGLSAAQIVLAAAAGVPDPALDVPDTEPTTAELPPLEGALQQAAARDPRILEAMGRLKAEEEQTRAIGAELRPDLSVTGTFSGRAGGATPSGGGDLANGGGWVPNVPNWDVGVLLSWPLFDGTVSARRDASRAQEEVRREEVAGIRYSEAALVRQAYVAVDVARKALPVLQQQLDAAVANYLQAEARFKAGLGTSVELADAEALRTDAEIQRALGDFELARARAALGRAIAEGL